MIKRDVVIPFLMASFAVTSFAIASSPDVSWIVNDQKVFAEAQALTKKLQRTVTVYSWVSRENAGKAFQNSGPIDRRSQEIQDATASNVADRMARFWDLEVPVSGRSEEGGAMAPNGLYVATEPVISRSYGGKSPVVYQMRLPKGMIFIDGRYRTSNVIGANLQKALKERGCVNPLPVTEKNPVFAARNLIKADTPQKACRQALIDIAAAVKAKAILYIFKSEPVPACKQVYPWNAAFVLVSQESIEEGSLFPIVQEMPNQDDGLNESRQLINAAFQNTGLPKFVNGVPELSPQDALLAMRENFFACNPQLREW